ncbi:hypothetical protein [Aeromonas caviae]|uniref:Uncharacterized protein n=1 Tax=Aeromonas caviae TaxID=648 RepID=A0AA43AK14_AERCA|nr:hypothetical protein [Aeromonas caviae]MDF2275653.1 hypothetical protein [Aeromonas caviae]MDH1898805.1 hypothetical protein [Aeromonas caviae]MEA9443006.1 hypothetical protein [Aeromonas caviae]
MTKRKFQIWDTHLSEQGVAYPTFKNMGIPTLPQTLTLEDLRRCITEIRRKTRRLATLSFSLFLIRLGFRAFGYEQLYHNPNDPYGISDLIEVALALIYLVSLGLCILHALWILFQNRDRGALGASALLALCAAQWHSYDYLHHLAASLSIP